MTATDVAGLATLDPHSHRLTLHVIGEPVPQGSAKVINGRLITKSAALSYWRDRVAHKTASVMADHHLEPLAGPVGLAVTFRLRMPTTRPRWQQALDCLPSWRKPDLDKLCRAIFDGLQDGGAYVGDQQVCHLEATKVEQAAGWLGAEIQLWPVELPTPPARGRRAAGERLPL